MNSLFTTDGNLMPIPNGFEERELLPQPIEPKTFVPKFMRRLGLYYYSTAETATASSINLDLNNTSNYATITSINGFLDVGKAKNVLKEEVINSNKSDLYIPQNIYTDANEITINFFVSDIFFPENLILTSTPSHWHIMVIHWYENFVRMFIGKKIWIKSTQHGCFNQFICMKDVKPIKEMLGYKRFERRNLIQGKIVLERIYTPDFRMKYMINEKRDGDGIRATDKSTGLLVEIIILNNEIFVGNRAAPDGMFELGNGRTLVIEDSTITQIIPPQPKNQ